MHQGTLNLMAANARRRQMISLRPCMACGQMFKPRSGDLRRGWGRCCSKLCARRLEHQDRGYDPLSIRPMRPWSICAAPWCGRLAPPANKFCSKACARAQGLLEKRRYYSIHGTPLVSGSRPCPVCALTFMPDHAGELICSDRCKRIRSRTKGAVNLQLLRKAPDYVEWAYASAAMKAARRAIYKANGGSITYREDTW